MSKVKLSLEIQKRIQRMHESPRLVEIAKELSEFGLAISLPHFHKGDEVFELPENLVQYEDNQQVSFVEKEPFEAGKTSGFPVAWRYSDVSASVEACAWCHSE